MGSGARRQGSAPTSSDPAGGQADPEVPPGRKPPGRIRRFVTGRGGDFLAKVIVVGLGLVVGVNHLDDQQADRVQVQANLAFVRQVATNSQASSRPFHGIDLGETNIAGLELGCAPTTVNATGAATVPGCADFSESDLSQVDLTGTRLAGADFRGADLSESNLTGADLSRTKLDNADFENADLQGADLTAASLVEAILIGAVIPVRTSAGGDALMGADFTNAQANGATFLGGEPTGPQRIDFTGTDLRGADLGTLDLTRVCFSQSTQWPDNVTPPAQPDACRESSTTDG